MGSVGVLKGQGTRRSVVLTYEEVYKMVGKNNETIEKSNIPFYILEGEIEIIVIVVDTFGWITNCIIH